MTAGTGQQGGHTLGVDLAGTLQRPLGFLEVEVLRLGQVQVVVRQERIGVGFQCLVVGTRCRRVLPGRVIDVADVDHGRQKLRVEL